MGKKKGKSKKKKHSDRGTVLKNKRILKKERHRTKRKAEIEALRKK